MKIITLGLAALVLLATAASADPRYDRKIEAAASRIIAEKIGELRGAFSWDEKPGFVVMPPALDPMPAPAPAAPALVGSASSIEAF